MNDRVLAIAAYHEAILRAAEYGDPEIERLLKRQLAQSDLFFLLVYALGRVLPTEFDASLTAQVNMTIPQEERLAIAQELFDRAFSLMGKSRPHPQVIDVEAIQASK